MRPTRHPHQSTRQTNSRITGVLGPNRLTSCPISRADFDLNVPTYAEHPSLQWIKARRLARPLFPQNSHVLVFPSSS